jgi:hypothetical protein
MNMIDKHLAKPTKSKRERLKIIKLKMKGGALQQIPMTTRGSLGNILKSYIPVNWKI